MNWAKWIVVAFVLFAIFIAWLVTLTMRQDISLVAVDYYEQELQYQQQLERKNNTLQLQQKPVVAINAQHQLSIIFPEKYRVEGGKVVVFRPSSAQMDEHIQFGQLPDNVLVYQLKKLVRGACRIKLWWRMDNQDYYLEQVVVM